MRTVELHVCGGFCFRSQCQAPEPFPFGSFAATHRMGSSCAQAEPCCSHPAFSLLSRAPSLPPSSFAMLRCSAAASAGRSCKSEVPTGFFPCGTALPRSRPTSGQSLRSAAGSPVAHESAAERQERSQRLSCLQALRSAELKRQAVCRISGSRSHRLPHGTADRHHRARPLPAMYTRDHSFPRPKLLRGAECCHEHPRAGTAAFLPEPPTEQKASCRLPPAAASDAPPAQGNAHRAASRCRSGRRSARRVVPGSPALCACCPPAVPPSSSAAFPCQPA